MTDTVQEAAETVKQTVEVDAQEIETWFHDHFGSLVPETKAIAEQAYAHLRSILKLNSPSDTGA